MATALIWWWTESRPPAEGRFALHNARRVDARQAATSEISPELALPGASGVVAEEPPDVSQAGQAEALTDGYWSVVSLLIAVWRSSGLGRA